MLGKAWEGTGRIRRGRDIASAVRHNHVSSKASLVRGASI